jgi:chromosome segregation ATPase
LRNAAAAAAAVSEPDDLAFLALWKRLMVRKQQLATAAQESEPLRKSNQQLRTSLAQAQDTIAQLQDRLKEATAERQKAVADKLQAEDRLVDVQKDREHWKVSEGQEHPA